MFEKCLHIKRRKAEISIWTSEQIKRFLEVNLDHPLYPFFYLALFTGLRRSELLGLQWGDIDWQLGQISIRRGYHSRGIVKTYLPTKTKRSTRSIDLPPSALQVLQTLYNRNLNPSDKEGVFWDGDKPLSPNMITKAWQRACNNAGVPLIRFHDARHTHASLLLKQGVHLKIVQERLGHSSSQITADIYSHILPGLQRQAVIGFDREFVESL